MTIEFSDDNMGNLLGRVTYSGDTPKVGTDGNLTSAVLGLNESTAVGQVDLTTQTMAEQSVTYTDNARESLNDYQRRISLTQAELEDVSSRLEGVFGSAERVVTAKAKSRRSSGRHTKCECNHSDRQ